MLTKKLLDLLNKQVEKEGYSSQLYLAMASWAETNGYKGVAGWLYAQSEEEREHMLKFIHYINERDGVAVVPAFEKPPVKQKSVPEMFAEVLKHEQFITKSINDIVELSLQEKDYTTHNFLQWFVSEQVEEEGNAKEIMDKLRLLGEKNLYIFDRDIMKMRSSES